MSVAINKEGEITIDFVWLESNVVNSVVSMAVIAHQVALKEEEFVDWIEGRHPPGVVGVEIWLVEQHDISVDKVVEVVKGGGIGVEPHGLRG